LVRRERHSAHRSLSGSPRRQLRAGRGGDYNLRSCGPRACSPKNSPSVFCASARARLGYPSHSAFTGSPAPAWCMGCGRATVAQWYRNRIAPHFPSATTCARPREGTASSTIMWTGTRVPRNTGTVILPETDDDADRVLDFPVYWVLLTGTVLLLTVSRIDQITLELTR
jgi:hypothetical protein